MPQVKAENLYKLPIKIICFSMSPVLRQKALSELIAVYQKRSASRCSALILAGTGCKQSDAIHDFLAFLAEQMITMNKEKQEEITGFLKDFERTIGATVNDLTNKTLITEYHQHSFDEVLAVLEKNRKKLKGFNPKLRDNRELLEAEFNKSITKLIPLKTKIQATDDLIDQIVYKLYGLSAKEIKIVEERLRG